MNLMYIDGDNACKVGVIVTNHSMTVEEAVRLCGGITEISDEYFDGDVLDWDMLYLDYDGLYDDCERGINIPTRTID